MLTEVNEFLISCEMRNFGAIFCVSGRKTFINAKKRYYFAHSSHFKLTEFSSVGQFGSLVIIMTI